MFLLGSVNSVSSTFLNQVALWLPKALNNFYEKYGANTRLSSIPGLILIPEAVRNEIYKYIGYLNFFIPHDIWVGFFTAVISLVIVRILLSIVAEIWFG